MLLVANANLTLDMTPKPKAQPEIRTITRLVPPSGNLVQGQSELAINPALAQAAEELIKASRNHYSPAEGVAELRDAVAKKIARFNNISVDPKATPLELLIVPGATAGRKPSTSRTSHIHSGPNLCPTR